MKVETVVDEHRARYTHPAKLHPRPEWLCFQSAEYAFSIVFDDPSLPPSLPSPSILRQTSRETSIYSASPFHEKPTTIHPGIIINRFEYEFNFFASSFLFLSSPLLFSKIETNCFEEEYTDPSSLRFIKDLN